MTSTSSDGVVARDLPAGSFAPMSHAVDLRSGGWTRLGAAGVLGDAATEATLHGLAERSRQAARAQGYAQGWAEGRRTALANAEAEAAADARARHDELLGQRAAQTAAVHALESALTRMQDRLAAALEELSAQSVEVALQVAEAVVGREVATAADPGADALRRAIALVGPQVAVTVRMHPADRACLDPEVLAGRSVAFADDPTLSRGDAVVETTDNVVDATLGSALARVREVLGR